MSEIGVSQFGNYAIRRQNAESKICVICVASIGNVGKFYDDGRPALFWEFSETIHRLGDVSAIFVQDRGRTWFNDPNGLEAMIDAIRDTLKEWKVQRVVTMGLSMGGFGALLLASRLKVDLAISIAPQTAIARDLIKGHDHRWDDLIAPVPRFPNGDLSTLNVGETEVVLMAGDLVPEDIWHIQRMPARSKSHIYMFPGAEHNLCNWLRDRGQLMPILAALIRQQRPVDTAAMLDAHRLGEFNASFHYMRAIERLAAQDLHTAWYHGEVARALRPDIEHYATWLYRLRHTLGHLVFHRFVSRGPDTVFIDPKKGWYEPESWGVWGGAEGRLDIPYPVSWTGDLKLAITLVGAVSLMRQRQTVTIVVNGKTIETVDLDTNQPRRLFVTAIPAEILSDGVLHIQLVPDSAPTPAELGLAPDARPIGFGIEGLIVAPVVPAPQHGAPVHFMDIKKTSSTPW
ncbi:hypothetical protein [Zavarzinia compransoris]|uniref:Alpha/beta hydrolase n=1 Tax=Zavarzinia compransoris TaxID=1264899 RepID=A0A317DU63_9PROT|nr:hypothetical protein [Zavarzinia compransoris]PWR18228.1 hypothetical protein DKG75_19860 [Zavarzinia compransoris]TDP40879.1 hypothetical protein DES42_11324 [Zavarzinia compransoris]